jgi:transcriptional repressor NrdR
MKCPHCGYQDSKVVDSRTKSTGSIIRRRRECQSCQRRFTTKEYYEQRPLIVVKTDQSREPFSQQKLQRGIQAACTKLSMSSDQIDDVVIKVEQALRGQGNDEVSSNDIGLFVMKHLKELDHVAYVRFASVYRKFQSIEDFIAEIQGL